MRMDIVLIKTNITYAMRCDFVFLDGFLLKATLGGFFPFKWFGERERKKKTYFCPLGNKCFISLLLCTIQHSHHSHFSCGSTFIYCRVFFFFFKKYCRILLSWTTWSDLSLSNEESNSRTDYQRKSRKGTHVVEVMHIFLLTHPWF